MPKTSRWCCTVFLTVLRLERIQAFPTWHREKAWQPLSSRQGLLKLRPRPRLPLTGSVGQRSSGASSAAFGCFRQAGLVAGDLKRAVENPCPSALLYFGVETQRF